MATDPNQILATAAVPQIAAANPFVAPAPIVPPRPDGLRAFGMPAGGMSGLIQAAQSADPNAWTSFLANPWAQHLQQRFGLSPLQLQGLQSTLAAMNAPRDARQYFQGNYARQRDFPNTPLPQPPQQQVGMVPGVPGSMGLNPGAQGPVMTPGGGGTGAPPQGNPMLPSGINPQHVMAGLARQQNAPGFGL